MRQGYKYVNTNDDWLSACMIILLWIVDNDEITKEGDVEEEDQVDVVVEGKWHWFSDISWIAHFFFIATTTLDGELHDNIPM